MSNQLTTQLWDLVYGLLDESDATELQERITSEPEVAREYARVQLQAELVGRAAKLEGPSVTLQVPDKSESQESRESRDAATPADTHSPTPASQTGTPPDLRHRPRPASRAVKAFRSILAVSAAAILCVAAYAYFQPNSPFTLSSTNARRDTLAADFVRLVVTGPNQLEAEVTNTFQVRTTNVDDQPVSTSVEYRLYDRQGEICLQDTVQTDTSGLYNVTLPAGVTTDQSRLEMEAVATKSRNIMKTHIRVKDPTFVTYLSTDKPLYRPGEVVYFRSLTLSRFGWKDTRDQPVIFELLGPAGNAIPNLLPSGVTKRGVGNGSFQILPGMPGGTYTIVVKSPSQEFEEQKRQFVLRDYRPPRLQKELEFVRDSYGPGDEVVADFASQRTEGGSVSERPLVITATVDGETVYTNHQLKTTHDGTRQIRFRLPEKIAVGDATLAVVVDDGGTRETIAKTIPLNLGKVDVQFFPEGGELVTGVTSRVYFFASDPLGKPVHIEGQIVDAQGRAVTDITTAHEGRGVFEITGGDASYRLKITSPPGVTTQPTLPAVNPNTQVVMQSTGVIAANQPVTVAVRSTKPGQPLVLTAVCRGASVGQTSIVTQPMPDTSTGKAAVTQTTLPLPPTVDGVIRLTLYDHSQQPIRPIAERLVYRKPTRQLQLSLGEHESEHSPGESVKLIIQANDEQGRPRPAVMGVTVVDSGVLNLADEKRASLTTQFRLAAEIEHPEDLEDIEFFVGDDAESHAALDLLLGTQGWRRFVDEAQVAQTEIPAATAILASDAGEPSAAQELETTAVSAAEMPLVYDNYQPTHRAFQSELLAMQQLQEVDIRWTGTVVFFGGAAILVTLMLLALLRLNGGVGYWLPMLGTATACLIVGGLWLGAEVHSNGSIVLTPFTEHGIRPVVATASIAEPQDPMAEAEFLGYELMGAIDAEVDVVEEADMALGMELDAKALPNDLLAPAAAEFPQLRDNGWMNRNLQAFAKNDNRRRAQQNRFFFDDGQLAADALKRKIRAPLEAWRAKAFQEAGMAGGFGGMGEYYALPNVQSLYRQLAFAAAAKDLNAVNRISSQIETSLEPLRFPVRQYAHVHQPTTQDAVRQDFTETIYWHPLLIADENGRAEIEFALSDSVTTFDVLLDGHQSGRIGTGQGEITARIPFHLEPKVPFEVTAGDKIDLPLGINNDTDKPVSVTTQLDYNELLELTGDQEQQLQLNSGERTREYFPLTVVGNSGEATVEVSGTAGSLQDRVRKTIRVVPPGFPFQQAIAGQLDAQQEVTLTLPETWVPGSLKVSLTAYPSALADIRDGIEGIIREPHGCFEQASSSNYPNIWALRFMQDHDIADPEFTRRAKGFLKNGYAKLVGYECSKKGYEWFGGDPGHEALTAYGLMEFRDMQGVWDVDQEMVTRTANWLMARRDGKGGFLRNSKALDSFGSAPKDITNAYIVWALTEAKQGDLNKELAHVVTLALKSDDPYLIGLAACAAVNTSRPETNTLLEKLAKLQQADGHLQGTQGSITRSGGVSLQMETTSLAAIAWLKAALQQGDDAPAIWSASAHRATQWIAANRSGGGGFGSTQATVLALKALVLNAEMNKHQIQDGALVVQVADGEVGRTEFSADQVQPIRLQGIGGSLKPGKNQLTLSLTGENKMPFSLDIDYRTRKPRNQDACPVRLATQLAETSVKAGATIGLQVQVENTSGQGQPMTTAIVGLPAGLEARQEKLDELQEAGAFDYYEQNGRELVFYWRSLAPDVRGDNKIDFTLDVVAEIPGEFEGPASRVYLYYTAEEKHWNDPLQVVIERE